MTRQELCEELQAPVDTPPGPLAAAWEQRGSELQAAAASGGQAKPVRLRLQRELSRWNEGAAMARQLRVAAEIARYFSELEAAWAQPAPRRSVARLCLEKARPLLAGLADADLRFHWEKRVAEEEERLAAEPPARAAAAAPATVLELVPLRGEGSTQRRPLPTVRLVARPTFTLGRHSAADFSTRFGPDSEESRQKTSTISRINMTLMVRGGQLWAQDGSIERDDPPPGGRRPPVPSRNGTFVDEQRLMGAVPLEFGREHRFKLGQYGFEVGAVRLEGCVRLLPLSAPVAPLVGVWIFSEASLGSSPAAAVVLDGGLPPLAVSFRYREAGFWLAVPAEGAGIVLLDGARRASGEVVALQAAHELWVGDIGYALQLR